jgi:hypothetical protein
VQVWKIICVDGGHPGVQAITVAAGEHLGERADMGGGGLKMWAASQYLLELELFLVIEVLGAAQHPGGDPADLGYRGCRRWCCAECAEGREVGGERSSAAPVALLGDLPVEHAGVGDAGVPALVQVGLVRIQHTGPACTRLGQQFLDATGSIEATDGLLGQPQFPHDGLDAPAVGLQCLDGLVAGLGTGDQGGALRALKLRGLGCFGQVGGTATLDGDFGRDVVVLVEATVVSGDGLLNVLGQVVPQVPPIGHLDRSRCPTAGSLGIGTGAVPADHPSARVLA